MNEPQRRSAVWTAFVASLLAATSVLLLCGNYRAEALGRRQVIIERGQTVLDSLAAGIRAHGRMGRYHADRLAAIFEELAATPGILALQLTARDRSVVVSAGDAALIPKLPAATPQWVGARLVMSAEFASFDRGHREGLGPGGRRGAGPGMGAGRGRGGQVADWEEWTPFPAGPCSLAVVLDAAPMLAQIRRDRMYLAGAIVICLGGIALGTRVVFARFRQRSLEAALAVTRERAVHHEQLAQLGAGLAHETKNPLGVVRGLAQTISDSRDVNPEIRRVARDIVDEADRTVGRINSFLTLARPMEPDVAPVDLDALLEHLVVLLQPELDAAGVKVVYAPKGHRALADEDLLRRAALNLVINAIRASLEGGVVQVDTRLDGDTVTLAVADDGCGIAPDDLPHVTEPYFSRFAGGCGLGLAIVDQIARAHGWRLNIESPPGGGARVSLAGLRRVA